MEDIILTLFRIFCSAIAGMMLYQVLWNLILFKDSELNWNGYQLFLCVSAFVYASVTLVLSFEIQNLVFYKALSMLSPISAFCSFGLYLYLMQSFLKIKLPFARSIFWIIKAALGLLLITSVELFFGLGEFFTKPVDLGLVENVYLKQNSYLYALVGPNMIMLLALSLIGLYAALYFSYQIVKHKHGYLLLFAVCLNLVCILNDAIFGATMLKFALPISFSAYSIEISVFTYKITRQIIKKNFELKNDLAEVSKVAEVGAFAGQICHDIRNPLSVLQTHGKKALRTINKMEEPTEHLLKRSLEKIDVMSSRINGIIQDYLRLMQKDTETGKNAFPLRTLIEEAIELNEPKIVFGKVQIKNKVGEDFVIEGHNTRLVMIFANLISNACDALQGQNDCWIEVDAEYHKKKIRITVTDSGDGIPLAIRDKIFKRQFSTKDKKMGSGLGLSFVRTIMDVYGGTIEVNADSPNTQFVLSFPDRIKAKLPDEKEA